MNFKRFLLLSISILIQWIDGYYLEATANYLKPKLERNNIVNKKVWVRNKFNDQSLEHTHLGDFIFRPESMDVGVLQNTFDRFGENALQETPYVTGYVQRSRRSPEHMRKRRPRKGMKTKKRSPIKIEDSAMIKSKLVTDLKPATVFNEYPYEVAMLLNHGDKAESKITYKNKKYVAKENATNKSKSIDETDEKLNVVLINSTSEANAVRRSKKYNQDLEENYKYGYNNELNNTDVDTNNLDKSLDRDDRIWAQNAPIPDSNMYKVITKEPDSKSSKGVTENGLIKVISMLTRSFKKIMRHQREVKAIHDKLIKITKVFDGKSSDIFVKFDEFESKYNDIMKFSNHMKEIEKKVNSESEETLKKCKNIEATLNEFKNQQKKFLSQQRQFFEIQKLMMAQNEKITRKQELISKTQSEISLRQNNFARILKKAKQIILDRKINYTNTLEKLKPYNVQPTAPPSNTQSMKINLFSIPIKNKLANQDELIIKEKDDRQIDDLVYKYYFNNTFIDNLMKSKILNNYATSAHSVEIVRNAKNKRDELETTLMIPLNKNSTKFARRKRWINSFGREYRHIARHAKAEGTKTVKDPASNKVKGKDDPFVVMATSFCKGIGQNTNEQSLKWCVEKALRKLKMIDMMQALPVTVMSEKKPSYPPAVVRTDNKTNKQIREGITTLRSVPTTVLQMQNTVPVTKAVPVYTALYPVSTQGYLQDIYFPDNDELESNLKQYELKPDTEGDVYYEGSVHISDFGRMLPTPPESEGTSDLFPGLMDSDSRVDTIDPIAFDLQAQRRASVRRINEELMNKMLQI